MTFFVLSVLPAPDSPLGARQYIGRIIVAWSIRDQDTLVLAFLAHVDPCSLSNREYMGRVLIPPLATILVDDGIRVKGEMLVWVDSYQE